MANKSTILVCIDTSNASLKTLNYALLVGKKNDYSVQVLSVMENSHKNLLFGAKAFANDKRKNLEKQLEKLVKGINQDSKITPTISIREGEIVNEILKEIKSINNCALLIFGKSAGSLSDNNVLPKILHKLGSKVAVPITIVPENLSDEYVNFRFGDL